MTTSANVPDAMSAPGRQAVTIPPGETAADPASRLPQRVGGRAGAHSAAREEAVRIELAVSGIAMAHAPDLVRRLWLAGVEERSRCARIADDQARIADEDG